MNAVNKEIKYKPGFVSSLAKIIIPILKAILPSKSFKWIYNKLYQLNMRRIWLLFSITSHVSGFFSNKRVIDKL